MQKIKNQNLKQLFFSIKNNKPLILDNDAKRVIGCLQVHKTTPVKEYSNENGLSNLQELRLLMFPKRK